MKIKIKLIILVLVGILIVGYVLYPHISYGLSERAKLYKKHNIETNQLQKTREKLSATRKEVSKLELIEKKQEKKKTETEFEIFSLGKKHESLELTEISSEILSGSIEGITPLGGVDEIVDLEKQFEDEQKAIIKKEMPSLTNEEVNKFYNSLAN